MAQKRAKGRKDESAVEVLDEETECEQKEKSERKEICREFFSEE